MSTDEDTPLTKTRKTKKTQYMVPPPSLIDEPLIEPLIEPLDEPATASSLPGMQANVDQAKKSRKKYPPKTEKQLESFKTKALETRKKNIEVRNLNKKLQSAKLLMEYQEAKS